MKNLLLSSCLSEARRDSDVADPPGLVRSTSRDQAALPGGISTGKTDRCREAVLQQKQQELCDMQNYAQTDGCYMEYLTGYFGDESGYRCGVCGNCRKEKFPQVIFTERIRSVTSYFMEEGFLPYDAMNLLLEEGNIKAAEKWASTRRTATGNLA